MITPRFSVRQEAEFIILHMSVRHMRVSSEDMDFYMHEEQFKFAWYAPG